MPPAALVLALGLGVSVQFLRERASAGRPVWRVQVEGAPAVRDHRNPRFSEPLPVSVMLQHHPPPKAGRISVLIG